MHTLQWIAVEADDKEVAVGAVACDLEDRMGLGNSLNTWYDWFIAGGGRYNDEDEDEGATNMILSAEEDGIEPIKTKIEEALTARMKMFDSYRNRLSTDTIKEKIDNYDGKPDYGYELYPLTRMLSIMSGDWDDNSFFFDLRIEDINPKDFLDSIEKDPTNLYLVPVDFHF